MWISSLLLLQSCIYMAGTIAQTRDICPNACQCFANDVVKCSQRGLQRIPQLNVSKSVKILDLSGNNISLIEPDTFLNYPNLVELNLGNNQIKSVGDNVFRKLPSLRKLNLNGNLLTKFPRINLENINTLDLSKNFLEKILFEDLKFMPLLEILILTSNKITNINDGAFFYGPKLKQIHLNNNLLTSVSGTWLLGLNSLLHLYLQNNRIVNVAPKSWSPVINSCCEKLKFINLANNSLERVFVDNVAGNAGRFADLNNLLALNLSSNRVYSIADGTFKSLHKLRVLDLSDNKLSWTSHDSNGTFRGLRELKKLNLSKNEITTVVKVMFEEIPSIVKLDITNNPIEEVTSKSFSPLKKLKDLRMNTHSLYCGCKLQWFLQWLKPKLKANNFSRLAMLKCRQPKRLYQRDFPSIETKDLVCDFSRPEIREHPQSKTALKGQEVRLSCAVRNGSIHAMKLIWKKDLQVIDTNHSEVKEITQVTDGNSIYYQSVLHLFNVNDPRDSGFYQCTVVSRGRELLKSGKARLEVLVAPRFTSKPRDLETNVGDSARFNCSASGDPVPKIYFTKKSDIQKMVAQGRIGLDKGTFIIRNITREDGGVYWCFAESRAGKINTTFNINIRGKPVAVRQMLDKVALRQDTVMFACVTSGWPRPTYVWLKDGRRIDLTSKKNKKHFQYRHENNAEYLIISKARESDAGEYKCLVYNALGSTSLTSRLRIVEGFPENTTTTSPGGLTHTQFIAAMVFTASCTMVITALICVAVLHILHRRGGCTLCPGGQHKPPEIVAMGLYEPGPDQQQEFLEMRENPPSGQTSPRSSSTFVAQSDEPREGSVDGRQSSGVCSMNSSASSLASATPSVNHRNTFPFSNTTKTYYPAISFYDTSDDSCASCGTEENRSSAVPRGTGDHSSVASPRCGENGPHHKQTLLMKSADHHHKDTPLVKCMDHHAPGRRKPASRSSRDRRIDRRHHTNKGDAERLCGSAVRSCDYDDIIMTSPETIVSTTNL